jgi:hypothetical protein
MKYQKTQKGNPHELTLDQHVFPRCSLARFADKSDDRIAIRRPPRGAMEIRVGTDAAFFCAMRVWDHGAESGFMKDMEDTFQAVAERVIESGQTLAEDQHAIVTDFYALWCARADLKANPIADAPIPGILGKQLQNSANDQEILEKNNIGYINENLTVPGRMLASGRIAISIMTYKKMFSSQRWGIVSSHEGEFIVPDQFGGRPIVPVTPTICLIANCDDIQASEQQTRELNQTALAVAREYVLARSFAACPT